MLSIHSWCYACTWCYIFFVQFVELDALGDDFLADGDTDFLDDTALPNPPTKDPVGSDTIKSKVGY